MATAERELKDNERITARILPAEEFHRVRSVFEASGEPLPDPELTRIFVVEDSGGNIIASVPLHYTAMVGLFHVDENMRRRGVGSFLAEFLASKMGKGSSVFAVAQSEVTLQESIAQGWVAVDGTLIRKDF